MLNYTIFTIDYSGSYKESYTNPFNANTFSIENFTLERSKTTNSIGITSIATLPDFLKLNKDNKFNIGLNANFDII